MTGPGWLASAASSSRERVIGPQAQASLLLLAYFRSCLRDKICRAAAAAAVIVAGRGWRQGVLGVPGGVSRRGAEEEGDAVGGDDDGEGKQRRLEPAGRFPAGSEQQLTRHAAAPQPRRAHRIGCGCGCPELCSWLGYGLRELRERGRELRAAGPMGTTVGAAGAAAGAAGEAAGKNTGCRRKVCEAEGVGGFLGRWACVFVGIGGAGTGPTATPRRAEPQRRAWRGGSGRGEGGGSARRPPRVLLRLSFPSVKESTTFHRQWREAGPRCGGGGVLWARWSGRVGGDACMVARCGPRPKRLAAPTPMNTL
jgi:hypothetical protein